LVAVEEGRGDLQDFHEGGSCDKACDATIKVNKIQGTIFIRVGGRNLIRRHEKSLKKTGEVSNIR
jgi:hypothetical protein